MARVVQRLRFEGPGGADEASRPAELMGPGEAEQRNRAADAPPAPGGVRVAGLDDDLVFLAAPQPGLSSVAADGSSGMKSGPPVTVESAAAVTGRSVVLGHAPAMAENPSTSGVYHLPLNRLDRASRLNPDLVPGAKVQTERRTESAVSVGTADRPIAAIESFYGLAINNVPVAKNDTATVPEDGGSVVIDVLANDTDADGDALRVDWWDRMPAKGTVFFQGDGKLKYVPFEDAQDADTFTYTATDSQGVSNTATVTVTITPENDVPQAFNDALRFVHPPSPAPEMKYEPADPGVSVLMNDTDVETPVALTVYDISPVAEDGKATVGKITMNYADGTFTWAGPGTFAGTTSFKYRTVDSQGAISDWARVKLWSFIAPFGSTTATANTDWIAVGDNPVTANVLANDVGGSVAVLASRPPAKRVTEFGSSGGFDGVLKYNPGPAPDDLAQSFSYRIFNAAGTATAMATVNMAAVNLELFHGQYRPGAVRAQNERDVGAFTVVNMNDTDGFGGKDHLQDGPIDAKQVGAVGVKEMDLMKLVVNQPAGYTNNEPIVIKVESGKARFYGTELKETLIGTGTEFKIESFINNSPRVYWVEIYEPASATRDVTITMTYKEQTESVKATGIWVSPSNFRAATGTSSPAADRPAYNNTFVFNGGALGLLTMFRATPEQLVAVEIPADIDAYNTGNMAEMEFTVTPHDMGYYTDIVNFDVTRSATIDWKVAHVNPFNFKTRQPFLEDVNDESPSVINSDNDVDLWWAAKGGVGGVPGGWSISCIRSIAPGEIRNLGYVPGLHGISTGATSGSLLVS